MACYHDNTIVTPEVILSLVCSELERGTNEEKEEGEEEDMETDQNSSLLSSLSSLLLQLSHDRAVVAINLLLSSLNYYSSSSGDKVGGAEEEEEEEEEDGEINTLSLAKAQLLEAVKQLLVSPLINSNYYCYYYYYYCYCFYRIQFFQFVKKEFLFFYFRQTMRNHLLTARDLLIPSLPYNTSYQYNLVYLNGWS